LDIVETFRSVLQCLCLGISCGFTTANTFSLWQVEQAEVSGTGTVLFKATFTSFSKIEKAERSHKIEGIKVSLGIVA
jgi:hypothetical protein